ncbi:carbohydrate esterase family 9 protein [Guyanagaster necrorhizus]|uniref:Carbohydrate esterase family 9 protein n=1 Tax=Guyanagaster necrorhizus TaxID=856835 RepID=A0A9P7VND1_9AGAR|nr:carbohydrate esterase family 9 protein [Guyanagaster necrorhizus MCA 3950]KAG7444373.1 carbohydrate esterase family 9 protein [Guyanagaster necrorhizus MCA 3950]
MSEKVLIAPYAPQRSNRRKKSSVFTRLFAGISVCFLLFVSQALRLLWAKEKTTHIPIHAAETLQKCKTLDVPAGPPPDFHSRTVSDRFVPGTKATLLKNATIWTGCVNGLEVVRGDILLDKGIIKAVGAVDSYVLAPYMTQDLVIYDLGGAWISPGIVDLHSHIGVGSSPHMSGASDTNSRHGIIQPWLRSLDGLNTHDDSYRLSISGGVTTALVLPGSANGIGGQGFVIKLRPTAERSPSSMLLEPPFSINNTDVDPSLPPRWRQMKHACGENPSRVYSGTRMDTIWALRNGYEKARQIKQQQDDYCAKALIGNWQGLGAFPGELQWEALVDVLRGRVKVQNHCYEAVDLDGIVRLTNEFKFSLAAFHHAHETYLVPDLLKKAYGKPPAIALFATNARYKREAYRGSEFAPRILADNGLDVVMKSDHPVLNSRYLLHEAQQAHYYGLGDNLALASVTSTPATVMGQDHRIGIIKEGYDADIVVWDSHPLAIGATPKQVYIDGIAQIEEPYSNPKPSQLQSVPKTPNFDKETAETLKHDGLPPLETKQTTSETVVFVNVSDVYIRDHHRVKHTFSAQNSNEAGVLVVEAGKTICSGVEATCLAESSYDDAVVVDLAGGSVAPGLVSFGSALGLGHIAGEASTNDGPVIGPLLSKVPSILGGDDAVIRASDGLQFAARDSLLAYRGGVTTAIVAPVAPGLISGLTAAFSTGSAHKLQKGAVVQDVTALHVIVSLSSPIGVSTQIATLRRLLLGGGSGDLGTQFNRVVAGIIPLVIDVDNADIMTSLIRLKSEIERTTGIPLRVTFAGAAEAHLLAAEIGNAGIGVVVVPSRPFPARWELRRILPGPPLSEDSVIGVLQAHNVTVGIGSSGTWSVRNMRFDVAWAGLEAHAALSKSEVLALGSANVETLLGVEDDASDLVATRSGSLLDFEAKVVGIISSRRGLVDIL